MPNDIKPASGTVYLVGAGPGDPKLITLRGLEALKKADAIVYDRLASPRLLSFAKPGAEKVYVGKLPDRHTMKQEEINRLLVDLALEGKTVVRLKGGDPCVFGRVGEEAELLADNGITFEIVPGITSAIAVPAYAGIPITHRESASSFAIVTGHENPDKLDTMIDWEKLSTATGTVVFLMGVARIGHISGQLMKWGKSPDTPVALVRWGTRVEQETLVGTLGTITELVRETGFQSPAVIVVGEVVELREKLAWFEKKPLFGRRILVTRARSQASELIERIDELGGEAVELPVIHIRPVSDERLAELDRALNCLHEMDWIFFTSVNGVHHFFQRLKELKLDIRSMHKAVVAAVGPKTAEALADRGIIAELLPSAQYQAEGLFEALLPHLKPGERVLLPRGDLARDYLPDKLREYGLDVIEADVYETVPAVEPEQAEEVIQLLRDKAIHAITFTSSSTVDNLFQILGAHGVADAVQLLDGIEIYCIGPVTAQTAADRGLKGIRLAAEATLDALVTSLIQPA